MSKEVRTRSTFTQEALRFIRELPLAPVTFAQELRENFGEVGGRACLLMTANIPVMGLMPAIPHIQRGEYAQAAAWVIIDYLAYATCCNLMHRNWPIAWRNR